MRPIPENPQEVEDRRTQQLADQRTLLEHLPRWLKLAGLRQKDVAAALGVSEATVSSWLAGNQSMSLGQLRQIAALLGRKPEELLSAPQSGELSEKVEKTLALMHELSDAEWQAVLQTARAIAEAKKRN